MLTQLLKILTFLSLYFLIGSCARYGAEGGEWEDNSEKDPIHNINPPEDPHKDEIPTNFGSTQLWIPKDQKPLLDALLEGNSDIGLTQDENGIKENIFHRLIYYLSQSTTSYSISPNGTENFNERLANATKLVETVKNQLPKSEYRKLISQVDSGYEDANKTALQNIIEDVDLDLDLLYDTINRDEDGNVSSRDNPKKILRLLDPSLN